MGEGTGPREAGAVHEEGQGERLAIGGDEGQGGVRHALLLEQLHTTAEVLKHTQAGWVDTSKALQEVQRDLGRSKAARLEADRRELAGREELAARREEIEGLEQDLQEARRAAQAGYVEEGQLLKELEDTQLTCTPDTEPGIILPPDAEPDRRKPQRPCRGPEGWSGRWRSRCG